MLEGGRGEAVLAPASYLRPYVWPRCVVAVVCMLSHSGVETSVPFIAKYTFDQVFNQQHPEARRSGRPRARAAFLRAGGLDFVGGLPDPDWVGQRGVTDLPQRAHGARGRRLDLAFFTAGAQADSCRA